ncbi:MAG: biotin/lipoyl-containing protein [Chloroflexota bacterium]
MKLKIKIEDQTYDVELGDLSARPVLATVDGETLEVYPEEMQSHLAPAASLATAAVASAPVADVAVPAPAAGGPRVVAAPIPGTIVGISVQVGDTVQFGQELCTLEAMKMKNAIRATRTGKVATLHISKGDKVKQGQPLLEYAD